MRSDYVLILAGNTIEREVLTGMLHSDGYRVFDTDSVQAARKIIERFPVDAVIVDRGFPADDSLALMSYVQARHPRVARVLMTHEPQSLGAMRSLGLGQAHTLLLKPIVEAELIFGLGRALRKATQLREATLPEDEHFPLVRFFNRLQLGRS